VIGEGLIFPALGAKIEMEKGGNLGNAIPLPDRAASQMDQVCDVATALAAVGRWARIGNIRGVQAGQFVLGGHTPVGITASPVVAAVALGFSPGYGTPVIFCCPHEAGVRILDCPIVIGYKTAVPINHFDLGRAVSIHRYTSCRQDYDNHEYGYLFHCLAHRNFHFASPCDRVVQRSPYLPSGR